MAMNCDVIDTFLWSQIMHVRDRKRGIKRKTETTSPMPRHAKLKPSSAHHDLRRKLFAPQVDKRSTGRGESTQIQAQLALYRMTTWTPTDDGSNCSACEYWKENETAFPMVADVARRRLCTQASSATSERSFSKAGLIVVKKRLTLLSKNVDALSAVGWDVMYERGLEEAPKRKQKTIVGS